jgi:Zn-dependent protease with chaperone function
MSGGLLELFWLVFLLVAAAWLLSAVSVATMIRGLVTGVHDPATSARRVVLTASIPWLAALTVGAAVLATAGSKALGWITDHCPHHGLGHPHLCFSHLPALDLGVLHWVFAAVVAVPVVLRLAYLIRSECRATREFGLLKALAASRGSPGRLRVVSAPAPFALAGGLFEPVVVFSRGLLDQLSFRERRIVMAHEAAHLRNGDAWRNVLFELLLIGHLPMVRRRLRGQWLRTLEERADDAVARRFGAESVVETLLRVARLKLHLPASGFSVAGANLAHRTRRLLDGDRGYAVGVAAFEVAYVLGVVTLFAAAFLGHHALETLLGLIAGH